MPAGPNLTTAVLDETLERLQRVGADPAAVVALREPKRAWTYARLHEEAGRMAAAMGHCGLQPGERLVLLLHEGGELAMALLGAWRAGLCAVPLPDTLRPRELLHALRDAGAAAVLAHADLAEMAEPARRGPAGLRQVLTLGGSRPGCTDFAALCYDADAHPPPAAPREGAPALLLYHTTPDGRMRAHAYPHEVPLCAGAAYCEGVLGLTREDRVFSTARTASGLGLGLNLIGPLRAGATSFLLPERARARAVFDVLGSFKPTVFCGTPTLYNQLVREFMEMSVPRPAYWRGVRACVSTSEPLPATVERRVRAVFQVAPLHCFVAAEGLHVVLSNREDAARAGSCGRPLPGIEARVHDERGQPAGAAEIGHLSLRGDQLRGGLWCGVTQAMLPREDEWLTLGDRFFTDEDGYFFYVGRADGMFKVDGKLVSPVEVEQVLLGHPAVWECAVTEVEDEDGLLVPKASVVLNVGREPSGKTAAELLDFLKGEVSPHKVPQAVEFVSQLPRGPDGKVARWRLRSRPPGGPVSPPKGLAQIKLK